MAIPPHTQLESQAPRATPQPKPTRDFGLGVFPQPKPHTPWPKHIFNFKLDIF
ncbi:hypothetical protein HanIR_Chr15g0758941 [Helianthus annuus]|nr:hypothetical protein HanIR_Chr15g0758941 [Helianthus annuus]